MSRASILAMGRKAAEQGMLDACAIVRRTGSTTDPVTYLVTEIEAPIYTGKCRVQEIFGFSRDTRTAPDQSQLARYRVVQLPVQTSGDVRVGDLVTITSSVNDPDLVGVQMIVRDQAAKSEATSRRVGIEEITG